MATAVASSSAADGPVDLEPYLLAPSGTTAPCAMGVVAAAFEYMFAPVDVTVVVAVECTVYGPRTEPGRPAQVVGVIVRLGGGAGRAALR